MQNSVLLSSDTRLCIFFYKYILNLEFVFLGYVNDAVQLTSTVMDLNIKEYGNLNLCKNPRFENLEKMLKNSFNF